METRGEEPPYTADNQFKKILQLYSKLYDDIFKEDKGTIHCGDAIESYTNLLV